MNTFEILVIALLVAIWTGATVGGAIVDAACDAWRKLTARPETITSIWNARLGPRRSVAMTFGIRT
jgi:hypothetical protein